MFLICSTPIPAQVSDSDKDVNKEQPSSKPEIIKRQNLLEPLIMFERTICYGVCPNYRVIIYRDGNLIYEGISFVKLKGKITSKISKRQLKDLIDEIKKAKYFNLRSSYVDEKDGCTAMLSDHEWVYLIIQINKRKHNIKHYLGCRRGNSQFNAELQRLKELERKIDEIIKIEQWIGTKEERSNFSYFELLQ